MDFRYTFLGAIHYGLFLGTMRFREVKKCLG
jgi:hypothetical protein